MAELRCERYYMSRRVHVITKINTSISPFYRRVAWFFTNLSLIATRNRHCLSLKGFKKFKQEADLEPSARPGSETNTPRRRKKRRFLLPPLSRYCGKRKTIFLDLDETLVHASVELGPVGYDFIVRPVICGQEVKFYVLKRPGVDEFLGEMSKRYELVVFTAALKEYAKLVVDRLDPRGELISHRLYRDSCGLVEGRLVKDLSRTGRKASDAVIVDDNPNSYALQPENAIPITRFTCDGGDRELERLVGFLDKCDHLEDMRDVAKRYSNKGVKCHIYI